MGIRQAKLREPRKVRVKAHPSRSLLVSCNVSFETLRECIRDTLPYRLHIPELGDFYGGISIVGDFQC